MALILARRMAKIFWFVALFWIGTRLIYPESFISLETSRSFALWAEGSVSQENFDDLWVLAWIACSFLFAMMGYLTSMWVIRKMRR
jgi:hypothetical protein